MTDLLTNQQKENIHKVFDDIHDTFSRSIDIYIVEESAIIDMDGNYNPIYGNPNYENNKKEHKVYKKKARVKYLGSQDKFYGVGDNSQINIPFPKGEIRLKVDKETYDLIKKCKKIKIDDRLCELVGSPARPGPFSPNYWSINLKQIE